MDEKHCTKNLGQISLLNKTTNLFKLNVTLTKLSQVTITAESSPLYIASDRTWTANLGFPAQVANH